jgi:flavorubredoxin
MSMIYKIKILSGLNTAFSAISRSEIDYIIMSGYRNDLAIWAVDISKINSPCNNIYCTGIWKEILETTGELSLTCL